MFCRILLTFTFHILQFYILRFFQIFVPKPIFLIPRERYISQSVSFPKPKTVRNCSVKRAIPFSKNLKFSKSLLCSQDREARSKTNFRRGGILKEQPNDQLSSFKISSRFPTNRFYPFEN